MSIVTAIVLWPKQLLHNLWVLAASEVQRCSRVPQIVDADLGQACLVEDAVPALGNRARIHGSAGRAAEDKAAILPGRADA